jgi:proteasome lid subunit RPN8/RPN11
MNKPPSVGTHNIPKIPEKFVLPSELFERMRDHAAREAPLEACGLVAGSIQADQYQGAAVYPVENILQSPVRFRMNPHQQIETFQRIEGDGLEIAGIYHSHPGGRTGPSPIDIAEAYYPEAVYLILSNWSGDWVCRAYSIQKGHSREIPLIII